MLRAGSRRRGRGVSEHATELAERLIAAREELGLTQRELAEKLGIGWRSVQEYEQGRAVPGGSALAGYAGLGVDATWLLIGEREVEPKVPTAARQTDIVAIPHAGVPDGGKKGKHPQEELWNLRVHRSVLERVGIPEGHMRSLVTALLEDDAMGPEMPRGSLVIADREQPNLGVDGTYALKLGDRIVVRFVRSRLDGEIEVSGLNPTWPAESVGALKANRQSVVGRVVGVLKRMA
jgi:transcriptional regulator with XRE-family HTH domain